MGLRENAERNSWILIGFLIGFYGNWFVTILDRLSFKNHLQILAVGGSSLLLLGYLLALTSTKETPFFFDCVLGLSHSFLVWMAIIIEGTEHLWSYYNYVGVTLWFFVLYIEWIRIRR